MTEAAAIVARVEGVSHLYGRAAALDDVTLDIASERMVGFIGPDGVGKSTLLGLIAGARQIQTGSVSVLGHDMRDKTRRDRVRGRIAYMPQGLGRNLYPTLSVFENVDFFGRLFGQPRAERERRITELLVSTGLEPFRDRPAGKLSGGMKQKLGLCCALIHDPDFLILDEPTTGVDPLSRRQFWELIDRLRARRDGMSVLVATAYMEEAERFDSLVMVEGGRVLATGTPDELKAHTGADTLEDAFIGLLPEHRQDGHRAISIPPRTVHGDGPAIEARGLTRRFGDFTAVDRVSFQIEKGEIFGFLGSNGCGKTTTMKMLTGLLPASEGEAWLFGHPVNARDIETRRRVGFMSQSFSLYGELSVRQNLELHARLFDLPRNRVALRVAEMIERFGLGGVEDALAERLPLGIRQRLSLAVAVIHAPEMLILDEPTSGVDPVARDAFWDLLIDLSRNDGVTIFISTHFMNEAERCDRVSLMHAGRVLAQDTPEALAHARGAATLEEAFIAYLEDAAEEPEIEIEIEIETSSATAATSDSEKPKDSSDRAWFRTDRMLAYAGREAMEIRRDPIRLAFALIGPIVLMIVFGYGISFDVEDLSYAVLDYDRTPASREYLENFAGSRYFDRQRPIRDDADLERRLVSGELKLAIVIPPNFGRDLKRGNPPTVGVWVDGASPFRAETGRGYVQGVHQMYIDGLARGSARAGTIEPPIAIETRFRYNQDFESVFAMVPGVIMTLLIMIPAMMTAVGIVREKEMGSITNLYATPVTGVEFLLGKQLPYVALAVFNFVCLLLLSLFLFGVPVKGSFVALLVGVVLYVASTTGFGLLVSTFMRTQIAAIFGTAILSVVPSVNFSGYLAPVSSLTGGARVIGQLFPSTYFQQISIGTFTKSLGFAELAHNYLALLGFMVAFLAISLATLRTQDR